MKNIIVISSFAAFLLFAVLSSFETVSAQNKTEKTTTAEVYYTCSMHPEVHTAKPGNCPKCGMELEKKVVKNDSAKKETAKTDSTKMNHSKCCMMH